MKEKRQTFFGGVPTEMDIKKLRENYPESALAPGKIIPYEEVEQLLHETRWSNRFTGVTNRWRRLVESENGIIIGTASGEGFKVLEEPEKVDLAGSKLRSAARSAKRSYQVAFHVTVSELSPEDRKRLDFYSTKSAKIIAASQIRKNKNLPDMGEK